MRGLAAVGAVVFVAACAADPDPALEQQPSGGEGTAATAMGTEGASSDTGGTTAGASGEGMADESGSSTGDDACLCAPGTDLIYVVSDSGELWSYDPPANTFALIGALACGGFAPFSMAVDRTGRAWLMLLDNIAHSTVAKGLFTVDINDPSDCEAVGYTEGLFGVFGMSFVDNPPPQACEELFVHSYSGNGPFAEGDGIGMIGKLDPDNVMQVVGASDFDGAELAGTSEGRMFSIAGSEPLKLIEYDRETAAELGRLELDGLEKTSASAMAFYGGDFYVFTEAGAPECEGCLETQCTDQLAACEADPDCAPVLACLYASGGQGAPGCEGDIIGPGGPLRDCLLDQCTDACAVANVVSKVTHVDYDDSDGAGQGITVVEAAAPVRIVGAASSTCVPVSVP